MKRATEKARRVSIREIKSTLSHLMEQVSSRKITLKDARNELSQHLEELDCGEEIIITRDGNPIAKVIPLS